MARAFNHSTWDAEAGRSLSLRPAWTTRASSRTARTVNTEKPCLEKQNKTKKETKREIVGSMNKWAAQGRERSTPQLPEHCTIGKCSRIPVFL